MIRRPMSHVLNEIAALPAKEQSAALERAADPALLKILQYAIDPNLKFLLPTGETPRDVKPNDENDEPGALYAEIRRLYLFVDGGHQTLKPIRREFLWVELLKTVHKDDAKLLDLMKDKRLPAGLKKKTVVDTFPNLITK